MTEDERIRNEIRLLDEKINEYNDKLHKLEDSGKKDLFTKKRIRRYREIIQDLTSDKMELVYFVQDNYRSHQK